MMRGYYKTRFPQMVPARNWDPQSPSQPTIALPLPKDENKVVEFVWPGMVLSAKADGSAWQVGVPAGETPTIVAIAQDPTYGSQSENVRLSGSLVGLPCTGNFRIVTPFFKRGVAYPVGRALTYCTEDTTLPTGKMINEPAALPGCVRPAAEGEPVIGYVVRSQAPKFYEANNHGDTTGTNKTDGAFAMQLSIDEAVASDAIKENSYFIEFDTAFQPVATAVAEG
jgi:hypothetical protein